jgi:hypothetical protein
VLTTRGTGVADREVGAMGRTREPEPETAETMAEVHERLGGIPMARILMRPPPGTATEVDLEPAWGRYKCIELIDGVLVEKPMGAPESMIGLEIGRLLANFVREHDLGLVFGADGPFRLAAGVVRLPDVSFIPWKSSTEQLARLQVVPVPTSPPRSSARPTRRRRSSSRWANCSTLAPASSG